MYLHTHWTACRSFFESYILIGSMKLILQTVILTCTCILMSWVRIPPEATLFFIFPLSQVSFFLSFFHFFLSFYISYNIMYLDLVWLAKFWMMNVYLWMKSVMFSLVCTLKIVWHLRYACTYTCIYMYMHLHVQYMHTCICTQTHILTSYKG